MAVDTEYLDELMKSIEPTIYPDGVPGEEPDPEDEFVQEPELVDYDAELASIPEKGAAKDSEREVESAIEAIDAMDAMERAEAAENDTMETFEDVPEAVEDGSEGWEEINVGNPAESGEIELDINMSEEEIEAMLNAAKSSAEEVTPVGESDDIADILSMLDGDSDIADIKDTLDKSDNNIAVNSAALDQPDIAIPDFDEEETEEKPAKKSKKAKKDKKSKGEASEEETEESGEGKKKKKGGLFSKLFNALTEEVPDESAVPEQSETGVTDENVQILAELDSEDKGKKKKKKKDKKSKDKKGDSQGDERDIREKSEDGDGDDQGNDKKKKKPKKEKKQKIKKEEEPEKAQKKLPKKRVRNTFILCLSILAAILVLVIFGTAYLTKKQARFAFDNADYETAYADFYGDKLSDSDNEIYQKSKTIMLLQRKMSSYDNYMQLGMKAEALNALLEGYEMYPSVMEKAEEYDVTDQVRDLYNQIVNALSSFGLSTMDAEEINGYSSKVQYNKRILSIVNNIPFEYEGVSSVETNDNDSDASIGMQDILPEEEDFLPENPEDVFAQ